MQPRQPRLRIAKFLGKTILGLGIVLLILVGLVHLPPVQRKITNTVTNYLAGKLGTRTEIKRIGFSLLGNISINELAIWDPDDNKVFSAHSVEVGANFIDLIRGDLTFDQAHLEGVDFQLIEDAEGLNIQFIIDAFTTQKSGSAKPQPVTLQLDRLRLEDIEFEFISNETTISVDLGNFSAGDVQYSMGPNKIKASNVTLQRTVVRILATSVPDTLNDATISEETDFSLDFGTDMIFEIKSLELEDDEFSFHRNHVNHTQKFDPSHLELSNIQLNLDDILIRQDTIGADLQSLVVELPGFVLTDARANIQMNHEQLSLSDIRLASGINRLEGDVTIPYDFSSAKTVDHALIEIAAQVNPAGVTYFLSDSLINQFDWGTTEFIMEGVYSLGRGNLERLTVNTRNSHFHAEGILNDVLDTGKMNWKDLFVDASIGSDFKRVLTPFMNNINLPPEAALQLNSTGSLNDFFFDGEMFTSWGNVKGRGDVALPEKNVGIDVHLAAERFDIGKWMNQSTFGPVDMSITAKGIMGDDTNVEINGLINNITLLDQSVHDIVFQSTTRKKNVHVTASIQDPNYRSVITSEILFAGPLVLTNDIRFSDFKPGNLLHIDSTLSISGNTKSRIVIDQSSLEGYVNSDSMLLRNKSIEYSLDTLAFHALTSPTASDLQYYTDHAKANLTSNFDLRDLPQFIQHWSDNIFNDSVSQPSPSQASVANFSVDLDNVELLKLLGIDVDDFSSIRMRGEFNELKQTSGLHATMGHFGGYGLSFDTLNADVTMLGDSIAANMQTESLFYDSIRLGDLDLEVTMKADTLVSSLLLSNDTVTLLGIQNHILPVDSGAFFYTKKLKAFDTDYSVDPENAVFIGNKTITWNHFQLRRDSMYIGLEGDFNEIDVLVRNANLSPLNYLISPDTTLISKGNLTGKISYSKERIDLNANIDSLILYNSNPLTISATAVSDGNQVPFQVLLTNTSNTVDLNGRYFSDNAEIDASLVLDINNPELFAFLVSGFIEEMKGRIKGRTSIKGPIKKPSVNGQLQFLDVGLTTVNPRLTFNVKDDVITLETSRLLFDDFTLYDDANHPLTINGNFTSEDYQSFAYDLQINSDEYSLINHPDTTSGKLRGVLVIDSDIKIKGDARDTNINAKLNIKDATDLTILASDDDIELLKAEGIIDFVDPVLLLDSAVLEPSANFYDSLIASLPDFNLNSTVAIEDNATFRVIINEQSGDYIEASGGANLELGYDRTGNLSISGVYTIGSGLYRLSFYDLVKKNFSLVQGSSINWSGSPENGELNIRAIHTVESNSLGLIGHEVGENEKSIYRRSLDYEVGININGTIERPIVSFSLDLPQNDKTSYPVLANKLDRLRQPEYGSELNKQVFGLLVLGGFIPENTGTDLNSNLIATTALSNSVNSLLASQLNRFANQYIKGVSIDVGIQSYSDYSAPGGKTQTAMDFRVTKSMMNDRLSFEVGGDFDINPDQSGANTGKNYRGDIAIIYDLTGSGDKQLKLFNNETYDIIYQEIRNTGISLIFVREFERKEKKKDKNK